MTQVVLYPRVLDSGLTTLDTEASHIYVCSQQPVTYTEAVTTYALGSKSFGAGAAFGAPAAGSPDGRQTTSVAVTNGLVTANGTVSHWAVVDVPNTRLLATGELTGGAAVTIGQSWSLDAFTIKEKVAASVATFAVTANPLVQQSAFTQNIFTFASQSIGIPSADRIVIVGVNSPPSASRAVTGVNYNAAPMTLLHGTVDSGSEYNNCSLWGIAAPSGSTANIEVTVTLVTSSCGIMVMAATGVSMTVLQSAELIEGVGWDPHSFASAVTVPASGLAIVFGQGQPATSLPTVWSPAALIDDGQDAGGQYRTDSNQFFMAAHSLTAGSLTPVLNSNTGDFGYGGIRLIEIVLGP